MEKKRRKRWCGDSQSSCGLVGKDCPLSDVFIQFPIKPSADSWPALSRGNRAGQSRRGDHSKWQVLYVIPYHLEWCPWVSSHFKTLCLLYSFSLLFWCITKIGFHIWEGATWGREGKNTLIRWWSAPLVNTSLPHSFHEEKFLTAFFLDCCTSDVVVRYYDVT